jgi:hypothetical protein
MILQNKAHNNQEEVRTSTWSLYPPPPPPLLGASVFWQRGMAVEKSAPRGGGEEEEFFNHYKNTRWVVMRHRERTGWADAGANHYPAPQANDYTLNPKP